MKVFTKQIDGVQVVLYQYRPSYDCMCEFSLMSEVGEPWMAQAKEAARLLEIANNATIEQLELGCYPWFADVLVPNGETK